MLDRLNSWTRTTVVLLGIYAGAGIGTLVFQLWVRSSQCAGTAGCALSFAKAGVWATIWPLSWVAYVSGLK